MNLPDHLNAKGEWVETTTLENTRYYTVSGRVWRGIKDRCKINGRVQKDRPSYVGCKMSTEFQNFKFFVEWSQRQIGYNVNNYELDKDILLSGNKTYGPDTCVYIPQALNTFFMSSSASRGAFPQGVSAQKEKIKATVNVFGKPKHLGFFDNVEDAYDAYKQAKERLAKNWAIDLEFSGDYIVDPRVIEALRQWELPLDSYFKEPKNLRNPKIEE